MIIFIPTFDFVTLKAPSHPGLWGKWSNWICPRVCRPGIAANQMKRTRKCMGKRCRGPRIQRRNCNRPCRGEIY